MVQRTVQIAVNKVVRQNLLLQVEVNSPCPFLNHLLHGMGSRFRANIRSLSTLLGIQESNLTIVIDGRIHLLQKVQLQVQHPLEGLLQILHGIVCLPQVLQHLLKGSFSLQLAILVDDEPLPQGLCNPFLQLAKALSVPVVQLSVAIKEFHPNAMAFICPDISGVTINLSLF